MVRKGREAAGFSIPSIKEILKRQAHMDFKSTVDNGRRSGTDRRKFLYAFITKERRCGKDRRNVLDKRSNKIKFFKDRQNRKWLRPYR